jgi:hypothetical protein
MTPNESIYSTIMTLCGFVPDIIWNEKYLLLEEHVRLNGLENLHGRGRGNGNVRKLGGRNGKLEPATRPRENTLTSVHPARRAWLSMENMKTLIAIRYI